MFLVNVYQNFSPIKTQVFFNDFTIIAACLKIHLHILQFTNRRKKLQIINLDMEYAMSKEADFK